MSNTLAFILSMIIAEAMNETNSSKQNKDIWLYWLREGSTMHTHIYLLKCDFGSFWILQGHGLWYSISIDDDPILAPQSSVVYVTKGAFVASINFTMGGLK